MGIARIHCFPYEVVGRVERGRGRECGRQKKFPEKGKKKELEKLFVRTEAGWEGCGAFVGCGPSHCCPALGDVTLVITVVSF